MDDLENYRAPRLGQSFCFISKPSVNSNWSYNPIKSTQLGNLDNLNTGNLRPRIEASVQDNTDQTTNNGFTIEEKP